jgi:hypothetical protein
VGRHPLLLFFIGLGVERGWIDRRVVHHGVAEQPA